MLTMILQDTLQSRASLRILASTDLHMQILPYDYFNDRPDPGTGLLQLADEISALRAQPAGLTLLFDNGDFVQGNPLADTVAQQGMQTGTHPMIAAFAALGYDAVALGNHEFNFGLPFLRSALENANFPVVCSNVDWMDQSPCAQPFALLDRQVRCDDGQDRAIRIGVLGFVPPQVTHWDRAALGGAITTSDIVQAAQAMVPVLQAQGTDIIVALCHAGIGPCDHVTGMENAAVPLAAVHGIDVVLTGHTHDLFPGTAHRHCGEIDPVAGRLHGKPAVGAGCNGTALGVITLDLRHDIHNGWQIASHASTISHARHASAQSRASQIIRAAVQADHNATLHRIRQPVARTRCAVHSFFARVTADLPRHILAQALTQHAQTVSSGLDQCDRDLPVIAAVPPFRAGGRAGAQHFVDIPPGPITLRDISAIYPYADTPVLVRRTGRQLHNWLEQAVSGYLQIRPGQPDQPLFDPLFAPYVFDALYGLTYTIDLTQPARHDSAGDIVATGACRISNLRHNGIMVAPDAGFVVVANSYRAFGGGGFPAMPAGDVLHLSCTPVRDILTGYLRDLDSVDVHPAAPWQFAPIAQASACFGSAPQASNHLPKAIRHVSAGPQCFHTYRMMF